MVRHLRPDQFLDHLTVIKSVFVALIYIETARLSDFFKLPLLLFLCQGSDVSVFETTLQPT